MKENSNLNQKSIDLEWKASFSFIFILYIVDFNCLSVTDPSFTMPFESPSNYFTETPDGNDKEFSKFPTPNGNTEEHWYSLRRCSRCKQFYTEAENQDPSVKCYFHTGKYTDTNRVRDGVFVGWSCCRFTSADYHNLDCKGCNTSGLFLNLNLLILY